MQNLFERYRLYGRARGFAEQYLDHVCRAVRFFDNYLGGNADISQVTADDFRRYVVYLKTRTLWDGKKGGADQKLSGSALNTYTRAIKAFFSWAVSESIIANNPLAKVAAYRKPKTIPTTYSESDVIAILKAVKNNLRNQAIVYTFLDSGVRLKELSNLTMAVVDLQSGAMKIYGKGDKERYTYLTKTTLAIVNNYAKKYRSGAKPNDPFFIVENGQALTPHGIQSLLARLGKKAGIKERLSPHKLRHTWATLSLKNGENLEYIRKMAGHSNIKTTSDSYLNPRDEDIQAAHQKSSPIENLEAGADGQKISPEEAEKSVNRGKIAKQRRAADKPENLPYAAGKAAVSKSQHLPERSAEKKAGESDGKETETNLVNGTLRLLPLYQDLYQDHIRKLIFLAGELMTDIESANLELPQRVIFDNPKTMFASLKRVYLAQNISLWPYLLHHLDNEFKQLSLGKQIDKLAAAEFWEKLLHTKELEPSVKFAVQEKLLIVHERRTLRGTCQICEGYFENNGEKP